MEGTGSDEQAPGLGSQNCKMEEQVEPKSQCSPVGLQRRPRPCGPVLFPETEEGKRLGGPKPYSNS